MENGPLGCYTNPGILDRGTLALTHNLPPGPICALNPTQAQLEQYANQAERRLAELTHDIDSRTVIGAILGQRSFTYGAIAGMSVSLGKSIYELGKLFSLLALAEFYEMRRQPNFLHRVFHFSKAVAFAGPFTASAMLAVSQTPGFERIAAEAYEDRKKIFQAVKDAFENPGKVFETIAAEYKAKYQEFKEHMAKHTLLDNFRAGYLFGELLLEILLLLDGVTTVFKIASKVPRLLKLLENLKGRAPALRRARAEATAVKPGANAAGKGAAKEADVVTAKVEPPPPPPKPGVGGEVKKKTAGSVSARPGASRIGANSAAASGERFLLNAEGSQLRGANGKFVNTLENDLPDPTNLSRAELRQTGDGRWKIFGSGEPRTPKGSYNFVSQDGKVYVGTGDSFQGHIDIARGNAVDYAGQISFGSGKSTKGVLNSWDNASGHYLPEPIQPSWADSVRLPIDKFKAYKHD